MDILPAPYFSKYRNSTATVRHPSFWPSLAFLNIIMTYHLQYTAVLNDQLLVCSKKIHFQSGKPDLL